MRKSVLGASLLLAIAACVPSYAQSETPRLTSVEPASGTNGDVLTVTGNNLDQKSVAALYLTDGKTDCKVIITEQAATSIKFKIPPEAKAGRFALMVLTPGKEPKLIEEPVKVTIEATGSRSTT
ncbi:MAG TPA: IPT/TIG domain-containing protein [Bryobacteraceae bacterium]|nr:IPT/TIG domain-containing protein [Bryobacteraceae bacterium]